MCEHYGQTFPEFISLPDVKLIGVLRRWEIPPSPPTSDPVGIENCKQLFSPLLAFTTQKIATHSTDIISAVCVAFFGSSMQAVMKKVVYSF